MIKKKIYRKEYSKITLMRLHMMPLRYHIRDVKYSGLAKSISAQEIRISNFKYL